MSATTGSINGKVADTTGASLPGVRVSLSGLSMQGTRTDVTSAQGVYRFPAIPPGDYRITYELSGFETVAREDIRIGLGFTATVNVELQVANVAESITVRGRSPVVDIAATKRSTSFDAQQLASLPNARDFWAILAATPAIGMQRIDVGGSAAGSQTAYSTYDTKADQHRPMFEGIVTTEATNGAGVYYDFGAIQDVSIATGANAPEMPWAGVLSQFVAKSGGNSYHGNLYGDYEDENIQSRNIDAAQIALGIKGGGGLGPTDLNRLHSYYDLNGDAGGYVKPDKLWWYSSLRDQDVQSRLPNFPVKPSETRLYNITTKGTYSVNANNKVVAFAMWSRKQFPNRLDTFLIPAASAIHTSADSTWNQGLWAHVYKVGWDNVVNNKMFFEIHGGQFHYRWTQGRYSQAPAYEDLSTNIVSGGNQDGWFRDVTRNQMLGSLSYVKDGWGGSHNVKVGGEFFDERYDDFRGQNGLGQVPGDVLMVLSRGKPSEVILFQSPSASLNGLRTTGWYASDLWRVGTHLTLTLGITFNRYRSYLPAQSGPPVGPFNSQQTTFASVDNLLTWNLPAPRLGLAYDLRGNGKSVLKAHYASYWWNPGTIYIDAVVNPNPPDWYGRYAWNDVDGNGVWEPGEQGRLNSSRGGVGSTQLDPNLRDQRTRELATWFERELFADFGVQAGFVWRHIDQLYQSDNLNRPMSAFNMPVTIHDPGPDGTLGAAGPAIQGWNLNRASLGLPVVNVLHNTPGRDDFYTLEFNANRRFRDGWSLNASYSYRWNRDNPVTVQPQPGINTGTYFGNNLRAAQDVANPNDLINTNDGRVDFGLWTAKINGSYDGPWGLRLTPAMRMQSGQPYARTFVATLNYGSQRILAEPFGTRQQDNIILLDARVERRFRAGEARTIFAFVDGYNLTNANPAVNINWSSGTTFMTPTTVVAPRIFRFGIKFDW